MQNKTNKIIAILLVFMILYSTVGTVVSMAMQSWPTEGELENQDPATSNKNVEVDISYEDGTHKKAINLSSTDTKIKLKVNVKNTGYLENMTVDFSDANFKISGDATQAGVQEIDEEAILNMINTALDAALEDFLNMRINEGSRLNNSILEHLNILSSEVEKVEKLSPETITKYKERLEKRLRDALSELESGADDSRILTEVAIFSDKVAVDEETVRLKSHIKEFKNALNSSEPIGKKLDFIVQEMNRETNTIGSKCNDIDLSKIVVEMKSLIEKIREQIQNIE